MSVQHSADGHPYWVADGGHERWLAVTHGAFGDHSDFETLLAPLGARYNRLYWDLPGHGANANRPARRLRDAAAALADVMQSAGVDCAHQLGFSFGGMVAQAFARGWPTRTRSLIAYACTPITLMRLPSPGLVNALTQMQMMLTPWPRFCQTFSAQVSANPDIQQTFAARMRTQSPKLARAIYEAMITGVSFEPDFAPATPTAQIKGGRDDRFPGAKAAMDALSARLPAELVCEIPGAGHLAHAETPALFTDALTALLERLEARLS